MKMIAKPAVSYVRYVPSQRELTVDELSNQQAREQLQGQASTDEQVELRAHNIALNRFIREGLSSHAFTEVRMEADPPVSTGWVRIDDPFEVQWAEDEWLLNNRHQIDLLMRTDSIQVPAAMVREHVEVKLREAADQGGPKRKQREIKDLVTMQLRRRSLPKMQLIEAIWDLSTNEVRVHTTSKTVLERFEELFNETFDCALQRVGHSVMLQGRGWAPELVDSLNRCVAVDFHLHDASTDVSDHAEG
ncbi:MAG TPA: hypothetical protein DCQ06_12005 [Myxococcales bacterium]|nr:hypothetical protein [Myxococcales bacterium]